MLINIGNDGRGDHNVLINSDNDDCGDHIVLINSDNDDCTDHIVVIISDNDYCGDHIVLINSDNDLLSFSGISDSLLATIGSVTREGRRPPGPFLPHYNSFIHLIFTYFPRIFNGFTLIPHPKQTINNTYMLTTHFFARDYKFKKPLKNCQQGHQELIKY